jgi:hypothetical protein
MLAPPFGTSSSGSEALAAVGARTRRPAGAPAARATGADGDQPWSYPDMHVDIVHKIACILPSVLMVFLRCARHDVRRVEFPWVLPGASLPRRARLPRRRNKLGFASIASASMRERSIDAGQAAPPRDATAPPAGRAQIVRKSPATPPLRLVTNSHVSYQNLVAVAIATPHH